MDHARRMSLHGLRLPGEKRVAITGLGAISAAGIGYPELWDALLNGRSGIGPITRFDTTGLDSRIGGEVKNFEPTRLIEPRLKPKRLPRQAQFAVVAAAEALRDAGLTNRYLNGLRVAVVIGSAINAPDIITGSALRMHEKGSHRGDPNMPGMVNGQASALAVAELLSVQGTFAMNVANACSSGTDAIKVGSELIRGNRYDVVVCGGTDAPVSRTPWAELTLLGMTSTRNDEPERAVRPFDRERQGGVLSEGSGIVILEEAGLATERGAQPYLEITGEHTCIDPERSRPSGGLSQTMNVAMRNAMCTPAEVDFISAWGCGDFLQDRIETEVIKEVFGDRAYDIPVGSIKGVIGSPLGAAGALQTVAVALSYKHRLLPPTVNWEHRDLDCDLDYIAAKPRRVNLRHAVLNAHGMGGGNTSMVFTAV